MSGSTNPTTGYDLLQQELGAPAQTAAPPSSAFGDLQAALAATRQDPMGVWGRMGLGARDVVQGAAELPGLVYDSVGNLINLGERGLEGMTGADLAALRIHPAAQNIDALLDAAGLPRGAAQPGWQSRVIQAAAAPLGGGAAGAALTAAAPAASAASAVGSALTGAPATQVVASAAPAIASLYTDEALKGDPVLRSFANAAAGLAAAGSMAGLNNLLSAPGVSPEIAYWAQRARAAYGLPLAAPDISQNALVRTGASVNRNLLLSGAAAHDEALDDGFTRALSNTIGADSTRLTPPVMAAARTRIGNELDRIGAATTVQADDPFINDLARIETDARSSTGAAPGQPLPPQMQAIQNQIDQVQNQAANNSGVIPGSVFQDMIKKGTPLDVVANNPDSVIAHYGQQVRDALFDAWERSAPPDEVQNLQTARFQYKNMKTLEPLAEKSPTGAISPALVTGAARSAFDDMAYSGAGPIGDLGTIGKLFLRPPPDSYTALRTFLMGAMLHPLTVGASAGLSLPANRLLGAGLRSDWLTNRMLYGGTPIGAGQLAAPAGWSLLQASGAPAPGSLLQ